MKKTVHILILVLSAALFMPRQAQAQTQTLSDGEQTVAKERVDAMLEIFLDNLSKIGSKDKSAEYKLEVMKSTLRLFLNGGEDRTGADGSMQKAPRIQISVLRNGTEMKNRPVPVKTYLTNMMNLNYKKLSVKNAAVFHLSNLYKVGDNYEATVSCFQASYGTRGDGSVYRDQTQKTFRVIVRAEEVMGEKAVLLRLGDIDLVEM